MGGSVSQSMKLVILEVDSKEMSIRDAAVAHGVPKHSLHRRVNGMLKNLSHDETYKNELGRYRAVLSHDQEKELVERIIKMDQSFDGLSINDVRIMVFECCEKNSISNGFNCDTTPFALR